MTGRLLTPLRLPSNAVRESVRRRISPATSPKSVNWDRRYEVFSKGLGEKKGVNFDLNLAIKAV
jgi:hypothetical protein